MGTDDFQNTFWIKEKSVVTLANRNICNQTQKPQVSSPTVSHQHMFFVKDEIMVLRVPLSFDLTYYQSQISENTQELDP